MYSAKLESGKIVKNIEVLKRGIGYIVVIGEIYTGSTGTDFGLSGTRYHKTEAGAEIDAKQYVADMVSVGYELVSEASELTPLTDEQKKNLYYLLSSAVDALENETIRFADLIIERSIFDVIAGKTEDLAELKPAAQFGKEFLEAVADEVESVQTIEGIRQVLKGHREQFTVRNPSSSNPVRNAIEAAEQKAKHAMLFASYGLFNAIEEILNETE